MSLADITKYMPNQLQRVNSCVAWVISEWLYCYEFHIKKYQNRCPPRSKLVCGWFESFLLLHYFKKLRGNSLCKRKDLTDAPSNVFYYNLSLQN